MGVFDQYLDEVFPHQHRVNINVYELRGGTPADPKVAEGWIKSIMTGSNKQQIAEMAWLKVLERHGISPDDPDAKTKLEEANATVTNTDIGEVVAALRVNGFARNQDGYLSLRRVNPQAMLKEVTMIAWPRKKWGPTGKMTKNYWPEHFFVKEAYIPIHVDGQPITEPHDVTQSFVSTWRGNSIKYEETVYNANLAFTILTDLELTEPEWGEIWIRAQNIGIGASRSQGVGNFTVTSFEPAT